MSTWQAFKGEGVAWGGENEKLDQRGREGNFNQHQNGGVSF